MSVVSSLYDTEFPVLGMSDETFHGGSDAVDVFVACHETRPDRQCNRTGNGRGNVSQWLAEAIRERLDREMWERPKQVDQMLGITEEWMYEQMRLRDQARGEAPR